MRISDWSSDVCSSDLADGGKALAMSAAVLPLHEQALGGSDQGSEPAIEPGRRSGAQPGGAFLPHRHGHLRHFGGRGSGAREIGEDMAEDEDRKSTRLNSSH